MGADIKPSNKGGDMGEGMSKKDMANIGSFGQGGTEKRVPVDGQPREERQFENRRENRDNDFPKVQEERQEERKVASKPVFTSSKKKAFVGGDNVEEIQQSKQNYDFSSM